MTTRSESTMMPPPPPSIKLPRVEPRPPIRSEVPDGISPGPDSPVTVLEVVEVIDLEENGTDDEFVQTLEDSSGYVTPTYHHDTSWYDYGPAVSPPLSVVELPVPEKPPPEVVDLMEDDNESQIQNQNEKRNERTLEEIMASHAQKFPGNPLPKVMDVEWICVELVSQYKVKGVQSPSRVGSVQQKTIMLNYFRHMEENQRIFNRCLPKVKEDTATDAVAKAAYERWAVRNKLNEDMDNVIRQRTADPNEVKTTFSHPRRHWTEMLAFLIDGKTELQSILTPKFSQPLPRAAIMNTDLIWNAQWSPLNLSMAFELFEKTMLLTRVVGSVVTQTHRTAILKKWYIEYMHNVASTDEEFLMAVISAFGTDLRFYPGRILSLFCSKQMLIDWSQTVPNSEPAQNLLINTGTRMVNPTPQVSLGNKVPPPQVSLGSQVPPQQVSLGSQVPSPQVSLGSQIQKESSTKEPAVCHADYTRLERELDFSHFHFEEVLRAIQIQFSGANSNNATGNGMDLFIQWYRRRGCGISKEVLNHGVYIHIENENRRHGLSPAGNFEVKKLTKGEVDNWRRILQPEIDRKRDMALRNKIDLGKASRQILMETGASLFQLSLNQEARVEQKIPPRNGWSPLNCVIPFELFKALLKRYMSNSRQTLKLSDDAIKVRYVEFIWENFKSIPGQTLLAIFSAFGPDLYGLPMRVLHILQLTGLLRNDLGLPTCSAGNGKAIYLPLNQNFAPRPREQPTSAPKRSSQQPTPVPAKVTKTSNPNLVPIRDRPATVTSQQRRPLLSQPWSAPPRPTRRSPPPPASNFYCSKTEWTRLTKEALKTFGLPELTGSGSEKTYQRHRDYLHSSLGRGDIDFVRGMLAGVSVALKSIEEQKPSQSQPVAHNYVYPNTAFPPPAQWTLQPEYAYPQYVYQWPYGTVPQPTSSVQEKMQSHPLTQIHHPLHHPY